MPSLETDHFIMILRQFVCRRGPPKEKHLKSVVADGLLSDIELRTLLAEVESIVNNRPITTV